MEKAASGGCFQFVFQKEDPEIEELEKLIEELYKKIGQQNIELEFLKKVQAAPESVKKGFVEKDNQELSIQRQCEIISFNRSSLYYERIGLSEEDQRILEEMDKIYLDFPTYGSRRMSREFKGRGFKVGRVRARSLMRVLGVEAIYPRKRLTFPDKEHQIYPYLFGGVRIDRPDIAWAAAITYIRLKHGFV